MNEQCPVLNSLEYHLENLSKSLERHLGKDYRYSHKLTRNLKKNIIAYYFGFKDYDCLLRTIYELRNLKLSCGPHEQIHAVYHYEKGSVRCFNMMRMNRHSADFAYEVKLIVGEYFKQQRIDFKQLLDAKSITKRKQSLTFLHVAPIHNNAFRGHISDLCQLNGIQKEHDSDDLFCGLIADHLGFINTDAMQEFITELYPLNMTQNMTVARLAYQNYMQAYLPDSMILKSSTIQYQQFCNWAFRRKLCLAYIFKGFDCAIKGIK